MKTPVSAVRCITLDITRNTDYHFQQLEFLAGTARPVHITIGRRKAPPDECQQGGMKKLLLVTVLTILTLSSVIALTACGSDTDSTTSVSSPTASTPVTNNLVQGIQFTRQPNEILISETGVEPKVLTIPAGTQVIWYNIDRSENARHWMKALDNSFSTQAIPKGTRMPMTFNTPGTYEYRCIYHRDDESEMGTIIVTE